MSSVRNNIRPLIFLIFFICISAGEKEILSKMSLDEKIGQLFMIPAVAARGEDHLEDLAYLIKKCHVGGIILKQGSLEKQKEIIQKCKAFAKYPLLIGADAENGLGMRIEDAISFPKNLALEAIEDMQVFYQIGKTIAKQCKYLSIDINFAPVVDVNTNPDNPIIGMRSFGSDPSEVSEKAMAWIQGHQEEGIMTCAKHFPGHGDTFQDSHFDLPKVEHGRARLERIEMLPFKRVIDKGCECIMTAHLMVPSLDPEKPASLSPVIVNDILRKEYGFEGLIITDALNMKALTLHFSSEEIAYLALVAGNDILLYGDHIAPNVDGILREQVPKAIRFLKKAFLEGLLDEKILDEHVLRILKAKKKAEKF